MANLIDNFQKSFIIDNRYEYILEGLINTLIISFCAIILGFVLGLIISIIRDYNKETKRLKIITFFCDLYVTVIRGTPILLQLMIIYYIIFKTININILLVGILAFGLNSAAYIAEIIRTGIESIDKGQKEAAYSLGLNYIQVTKGIILPQALKNSVPTLGNEAITIIKETSVAGYIGIIDLTKASDIIASRTYDYLFPLMMVALIYLFLTYILTYFLKKIEKKENR